MDEQQHSGGTLPRFDARLFGRRLSSLLLAGALVLGAYPPVTMALGEWRSRQLDAEYERTIDGLADSLEGSLDAAGGGGPNYPAAARALWRELEPGRPFARLKVDRIDVDEVVVAGSRSLALDGDDPTLRGGPAHIRSSSLPGAGSNTAIAGHRTTYTHPFWSLEQLEKGDRLVLEVPYARFTYRVHAIDEVRPHRIDLAQDHGFEELTLATCSPRFSATRRLVVRARITSIEPLDEPAGRA